MQTMQTMTIGTLAKQVGVGAGTLRYYERLGLLAPEERTAAGYRIYRSDAARRLRFIRRAQALGFSLEEIATLLALNDNPQGHARDVKRLSLEKIRDIEARLHDLQRMKQALEELADHCNGKGSTAECPILAALNEND